MSKKDITPDYILIDGHNMAYKRFNALHRFTSHEGFPTGMIFGMVNSLTSFKKAFPNAKFLCCFDKFSARNKSPICPEYKANRCSAPAAFHTQLSVVRKLLPMMGFMCTDMPGYEADQLLATYAKVLPGDKLIVSDDKDLAQCVNDHVHLYQKGKKTWVQIDADDVLTRYGVPPEKIADWLALAGDKADNIPGIHGIGDATACRLLENHKSAMDIAQDPEVVGDPRYANIFTPENVEKLKGLLNLTTLPGDVDVSKPEFPEPNPDKALALLQALDLKVASERVKMLFPDHAWKSLDPDDVLEINHIVHRDVLQITPALPEQKPDVWDKLMSR